MTNRPKPPGLQDSPPSEIPTDTVSPASASRSSLRPIRWAYIAAIAIPLIVLNTGWIANSEMRTSITEITISTLFIGVTFILFLLTLVNLLVGKIRSKAALNQPELMVLYTLLSMSSVVAGVGHYGFFTPLLSNAFYYATPSNGWSTYAYLLPKMIGPRDPAILKGFYDGHSSFFQPQIMAAWAPHLFYWSIFFLILLWMTLCLSAFLRKRWSDEEHLPFPVIVLPLEITREGAPIYRNPLLWAGFALPTLLNSLNSLQTIFPAMPTMHMNSVHDLVYLNGLQTPWSGAGTFFYQLHLCGVGFGYLVNTDVSFSLWFFYLVKKAACIWGVMEGWRDPAVGWFVDANGQFPYVNYQAWGAWLALGISTVWAGRTSFKLFLRKAISRDGGRCEVGESMSARLAVVGFFVGFLALCGFVWAWGGSWWLPIGFLVIYLLLMITLTRIRAEAAVLSTELVWVDPQSILTNVIGTGSMSHVDLAHTATLSWFNLDYRAAGMPQELEGMVALQRTRGRTNGFVIALMLAAALAMGSALLWDMQLYYTHGANTGNVNPWRISEASIPWNNLHNWLTNPQPFQGKVVGGMGFGVAMVLLMSLLRATFTGFPLNPAAYALNITFANNYFWCDMLVAWLIKSLILRYGGLKVYRQFLPFFLGLILGDFVSGAAWSIAATLCHASLYRTFPN